MNSFYFLQGMKDKLLSHNRERSLEETETFVFKKNIRFDQWKLHLNSIESLFLISKQSRTALQTKFWKAH